MQCRLFVRGETFGLHTHKLLAVAYIDVICLFTHTSIIFAVIIIYMHTNAEAYALFESAVCTKFKAPMPIYNN